MPSSSSSVAGAKGRSKTALGPGYSLMAWMRLSQGADLSGGVGAIDPDEDEAKWKEWDVAELSQHNSAEDAWMVIHGRVYNITPYLRYHPGGVSSLLDEAGNDGTALFEKYHPWVNTAGILEACCVGRLAKPTPTFLSTRRRRWSSASTAATGVAAPADVAAAPDRMGVERPRARVTWDEAGIQAHDAERGVRFGTMKIDQPDTPFLFLDADDPCGEIAAIHPKYLATHVPTAERTGAGPHRMHVKELQDALGLVTTDEEGLASFSRPKWSHSEGFEAQRQALYRDEARVAALSVGLPDGWAVLLSTSEPREPFYHHEESNLTQWKRPV